MFTVAVIAKISRPSDSTRVAALIPRQGLPMLIAPRQITAISDAAVGAGPARAWLV
jgi:hypothetical protein